jgi:hypothetical protein
LEHSSLLWKRFRRLALEIDLFLVALSRLPNLVATPVVVDLVGVLLTVVPATPAVSVCPWKVENEWER